MSERTFQIGGKKLTTDQLIEHLNKVYSLLRELSTLNDWELPYRVPPLIEKAIELRREVST